MSNRLALYLPSLNPGGVQRVMLNLARGLTERGQRVDLVLAQAEGPFLNQIPAGVRLVDLRASRVLASFPALVKYLLREQPTAMLAAQTHCNLVALLARRMALPGMRLIISEHGHVTSALQSSRRFAERFYPFLMRMFYHLADRIVAVSYGAAADLAKRAGLQPEKITVIYNPVVTPDMDVLMCTPLVHPWFAANQPPVILAVGRLDSTKDYPTLLHAYAILRSRRLVRLVILGEGLQRHELQSMVAKLHIAADVYMPGFADNPFAYMARCAVFVLSSRWEGFGNVLVEAMACGAQVVSTDCPSGPAEILENGRYGRLVPVGDPYVLAAAIETALDNPIPVEQVHARAFTFSIPAAVEKYFQLLIVAQHA